MTTRRPSKALQAAQRSAPSTSTPAVAGLWDRKMIEGAATVFADLQRGPLFDRGAVAERLALWYRFVDVVAAGRVADDAVDLAAEVIRAGVQWLDRHPDLRHVAGPRWSVADVEGVARWFGAVRNRRADDADRARVAAFERVVRTGLVVDDGAVLAGVVLEALESWSARR